MFCGMVFLKRAYGAPASKNRYEKVVFYIKVDENPTTERRMLQWGQ
tara:strand:+ start:38789 stop:38926 length:138 start_codon:yes stop_codon:yes gene_type:complete